MNDSNLNSFPSIAVWLGWSVNQSIANICGVGGWGTRSWR